MNLMTPPRTRRAPIDRLVAASIGLALAVTLAPAAEAQITAGPSVGPERGTLVIIGGALQSPEIYERIISLAGGPDAHMVMIPTAGGGGEYDRYYRGLEGFREHGARNMTVLHTTDPEIADTEAFVEPLKTADAVYFFGGRQWRLVDAYGGTRTEEEIRNVLDRGGVIAGSSAGASIMGSLMIRGDTRTNTIMLGDHQRGFGYLRNVGIDQHVMARNRQFDMLEVMDAHPDLLGIGIDENTALVVRGDQAEVIGETYVLIYDNQVTVGDEGRFYFLRAGDRIDLGTRQATRPSRTQRPIDNVQRRPRGGR